VTYLVEALAGTSLQTYSVELLSVGFAGLLRVVVVETYASDQVGFSLPPTGAVVVVVDADV
jgi:hypothetical protein